MKLPDEVKELAAQCNDKHVRVVQAILSGDYSSNTKAYQSIYNAESDDSAKTAVSRMLTIDNVKALYAALKEITLLDGILTRSEAMKILSDMASTDMGDVVTFGTVDAGHDDDGEPVQQAVWCFKNKDDIPKAALRSIKSLKASPQGLVIEQHDQKAAIKQLSEMMGWNSAKEVKVSGSLESDYLKALSNIDDE